MPRRSAAEGRGPAAPQSGPSACLDQHSGLALATRARARRPTRGAPTRRWASAGSVP